MYSPINGAVFNMLTKDPVTLALKEIRQKESLKEANEKETGSDQQMEGLELYLLAIDRRDKNQCGSRAA
jgi:hypothetical protein